MGKRRRIRRLLAGLILLLIVVGAAWTGLWFIVAGRLADHVATWEQERRAQGWTITHGAERRVGWPMAAGIMLPDLSVTGAADILPGGIGWSAKALTLALDIRHPNDLYLGVTGKQGLRIAHGAPIPFEATHMAGRVVLQSGDHPGLVQMHATGVLAAVGGEALSITDITAALRADPDANVGQDAVILAISANGIGLPSRLNRALGKTMQGLSFDAALTGPAPPAATGSAPDPTASATAWRNAGGGATLRALHLAYGPLGVSASGRFQLDAALMPTGTLAVQATGLDETLDRLAAARDITRSEVVAMKGMLGLLMAPPKTDSLNATLTLRAGLVSLGTVPLLRLPD